jgi:putative YhbY family RNA-binding protein
MAEIPLTAKERQALKARAHPLKPVVLLGAAGLTPAVVKEIDRALAAHQLIKVRVPGDDRSEREAVFAALAGDLSAARVQAIGKLLVLFRPVPDEPTPRPMTERNAMNRGKTAAPRAAAAKRSVPKTSRSKPLRNEVERVQRGTAPRRDPGEAHRAAGRRNAPKRRRS